MDTYRCYTAANIYFFDVEDINLARNCTTTTTTSTTTTTTAAITCNNKTTNLMQCDNYTHIQAENERRREKDGYLHRTKSQISSNCTADQAFVFATRIVRCLLSF